ncbi:Glycoside hydrolase, family 20, catalytic core [Segniliparus rotundus DSM 44985]|uniref:Glycoside hydrolase, family 20, catalytic core n=1 Tax=Segniliparus rotundus (strain ATCC BAA-972 / CDC 1076 / CIP 108378 / DSM 44985 / JCM 13578) TaxID=640132 RepID=D6Z833_SEGRD|nr:family 20 glycosylhydrolase [Segniliparus rotundus]ADG98113.1 Glycoside hydrolase, family 20, catalytic core [Segniliparus rotundus DSM 44985]
MSQVFRFRPPRRAAALIVAAALCCSCAQQSARPEAPSRAAPSDASASLASADGAVLPPIIPSVQRWAPSGGAFHLGAAARIVAPEAFRETAEVFAEDLGAVLGRRFAVAADGAVDGDIELRRLGPGPQFGAEGYEISVARTLVVSATDDAGAFLGTRTAVQWLRQSPALPGGTARDWPNWPERAFMVDVARKFYTVDWLRERVRELSYLKYNTLHLHLSDSQAFRVQSDAEPEAVAPQHYSKAEIADLVAYAGRRHITVIPEFDLPGHASALLARHSELGVKGEWGLTVLNLAKPEAWELAARVIREYLPLFPAKVWFLGADEWMSPEQFAQHPELTQAAVARYGAGADPVDLFHGFINEMDELVKAAGKSMRIWNSALILDSTVPVAPDISIDHWSGAGLSAQEEAAAGHQLLNSTSRQLYYVIGRRTPDPATVYRYFSPDAYPLGASGESVLAQGSPEGLGAELCLWEGGHGPDEADVAATLGPMLRALAQVVWGSPKITEDYAEFVGISDAVGSPPGP